MLQFHKIWIVLTLLVPFAATVYSQDQGSRERREREGTIRARYEHWLKKRLDENGNFSMDAVLRAKAQLDAKPLKKRVRTPLDAGIWNWQWLGPGNIGGRIRDIIIHPTSPNLMWIASPGGGIWKTTNSGFSWSPVDDFLPILNVVSLAMDPIDKQVMYAGTGELDYQGWKITGVGIYKSTNGGNNWLPLSSTVGDSFHYVSSLAHHPTISNRLLAAAAGGLYLTTNGGSIWTRVLAPAGTARDVKYHPLAPNKVLVGTTAGVYLSTDGGTTWNRQDTTGKILSHGSSEVAFARSNANYLYASIAVDPPEVWRSTTGGDTWELRSTVSDANPIPRTNAIWVSPTNPDEILVGGTDNLLRNTNGGSGAHSILTDWRCYHNGRVLPGSPFWCPGFSPHGDFHVIVSHPDYNGSTNKTVYLGNDGGIQYTTDISTVSAYSGWENLANNLGITQFYGGAAAPDGRWIVGGTQDLYNVSYYKNDPYWGPYSGPQGWWNYVYGDGGFAAIDFTNPRYIYAESQNLGFDRSDDSGKTYRPKRNGLLDAGTNTLFIAPFVMDPNDPTVLIAGGASIWRTTDRAENWWPIQSPVAGNPKCSAIDIWKSNSGVIWVGYDNGLVSYTMDNGSRWNDAGKPGGNRFVTDIAINPGPMATAEVIVTVGGYESGNVWLTTNNGATWDQRTGTPPNDLPALQVNTVRYHPLQADWIYVGTDLGVFASEDKGITWKLTPRYSDNEGPLNTPVEELFWQGTTYLIAATHGRGMWRCKPLPIVYVDRSVVGWGADGTEFNPYKTVQEAINEYGPGALVSIKAGTYDEPVITINKRGRVRATNGSVLIK